MTQLAPSRAADSQRLRVLHVAPLPPPWTGIGVSFEQFIRSAPLARQANWVINSAGAAATSSRAKRPTLRRIVRHARLTAHIVDQARRHRVDVVHLHGSSHDLSFVANGLSLAAAGMMGARTVWHLHEDLKVVQFPGRGVLTRATFAGLTRLSSVLAVLTDKDRLTAESYVPAHRVAVIPPTCSPEMVTLPLERAANTFNVLFVGWLSEAKGIFDLIRVATLLRQRSAYIRFEVVGVSRSSEQTRQLAEVITQHHLQSVISLRGLMTGPNKYRMFADSHVLFTPTHWDAFPVTVLEAMSAGLPVVGTRVGGLPLMLEEGAGARLSPVGDVCSMADHLLEFAGDPDLRRRMGAANRQRFVQRYHPDRVGQTAVNLYERLTADARGAG
jgi:glycosyltransferase involved in cell wall biosynthesis